MGTDVIDIILGRCVMHDSLKGKVLPATYAGWSRRIRVSSVSAKRLLVEDLVHWYCKLGRCNGHYSLSVAYSVLVARGG